MSIQKQMVEQLYGLAEKAQQPDQIKALQDQITKSIQDGAVPSYAAIPLVQELTDRYKSALEKQQMAGQPQAQGIDQPPIAQEVLAQAQGIDNMPSNLPAGKQAYAAGGIVAFAEGDLVDDDDETEDDRQEASLMALMDAARNKIQSGLGSATSRFTSMLPQSYEATKAAQQAAPTAPAEGGLSGLLSSAATKYGVPTALLSRISGSESSGRSDAANPRSSAKGVFQFTDSTWKGMGGKPGEQFNPEANVDLGAKYIRQNAEHLKSALGRDPTYHEVYAAHMFGPGVSRMLNKANPKDPIEHGLSLFENPQQVRAIMKANPNLRGKTVGQVLDSLQGKTGEGIVALAQGGEIKHFSAGGSDDDIYSPEGVLIGGGTTRTPEEMPEWEKEWERKYGKPQGAPGYKAHPEKVSLEDLAATQEMENQEANKHAVIPVDTSAQNAPQVNPQGNPQDNPQGSPQTPVTEAVDPYLEKYMSMLQKRETESERQKGMDGYMALMQAGLGMMGGSSPYALQNIGAGGTQGLTAYAAAQKQRAAEDAATLSGYGKLYTAKETAGLRRDLAAQGREERESRFDASQESKYINTMANAKRAAMANIVAAKKIDIGALDQSQLSTLEREVEAYLTKDPAYQSMYKKVYGTQYNPGPVSSKVNSPEFYQNKYNTAPKTKE